MGIPLLDLLLDNISDFFLLASLPSLNLELFHKYYQETEDILKPLKTVLNGVVDNEISSERLQKAYVELSHAIDELQELFETWQILNSKVYFVLQAESLIAKVRTCSLAVIELLVSSNGCLRESSLASVERCVLKIESMDYELLSTRISKAVKDVESPGVTLDSLAKIADYMRLNSNQELLIELVSLEKLKENAEQADRFDEVEYIEQIVALVTRMHNHLVTMKQSEKCSPVPIPADFCCSLSLELMTDPVIVASGQTYERAFIRQWIDLGLVVCPKTRQALAHTNLIPNYTVKALIENWCVNNNVKLPDPVQSLNSNQPSSVVALLKCGAPRDNHISPDPMENNVSSPDSARSAGSPRKSLLSSSGVQSEAPSSSHSCSSSEECLPGIVGNAVGSDVERMPLKSYEDKLASSGARSMNSGGHFSMLLSSKALAEKDSRQGHNRTTSAPSTLSHSSFSVTSSDGNETSSGTNDSSDASVEVASGSQPASALAASRIESELSSTPVTRPHCIPKWSRQCERFFPRIVSSSATETRADLVEVEEKARKLVEDLKTPSIDVQRNATAELRFLAKLDMDNRVVIANFGAISALVSLLHSEDTIVQENAVTAILNLSINDNNKYAIAKADAIEPLVHVLETGSPEAKENAAATLFSISVIEDCKMKIGRSGAINALVNLLGNGTPRGKKDAATALFNLSILHENKARIVQAGAVKHLIELMDPAAALIDKAVAVLSNLSSIHPGRIAIGQEGGISVLVDAVELGSARVKEHAAAALMQLCTNSVRHCNMALRAGAVPPLVSLSRCGTPRAREKAQGILGCFRNQRNVNVAKS
ncbi:U-box domain-containing protein 4-like [Ipomoea triloba]|uniref:U-box domain-containing protein 4-like n=1 Tax=Ipomoea triloba TaxID=35885 RepID=UPI00125E0C5D|nr:U-box domain-containing protein 4-like [Ipomoea triloba]